MAAVAVAAAVAAAVTGDDIKGFSGQGSGFSDAQANFRVLARRKPVTWPLAPSFLFLNPEPWTLNPIQGVDDAFDIVDAPAPGAAAGGLQGGP